MQNAKMQNGTELPFCIGVFAGYKTAMIDLKDLRENPDRYRRAAKLKRIDVDVDKLLALDATRRQLDAERQQLTAEKNALGKQIGPLAGKVKKAPPSEQAALQDQLQRLQGRAGELKAREQELEPQIADLEPQINELLLRPAQPPDADVPAATDATANGEIN